MINFTVDTTQVMKEFEKKLDGIGSTMSQPNRQEIVKAVFTISVNDFIRKTNARALGAPKAFHHVYEWNHIGQTKYKLYNIKRGRVSGGSLRISYSFADSKTDVPIPLSLRRPNKKGKFVSKTFVFKKKAQVMESGNPTRPFSSRSAKALVFEGRAGKPIFVRKPRTVVVRKPGGRYTKGAFDRHFRKWFENPSNIKAAINRTSYFKNLEKEVSKVLNQTGAGKTQVAFAIKSVSRTYSKELEVI